MAKNIVSTSPTINAQPPAAIGPSFFFFAKALKIADKQVGDWNRFHVIMRGDKVTVWLNGELVVDNVTLENYWDRKRPIFFKEQIELQCHGDPTEWRNIFIRKLPVQTVPADRVGVCSWSWRKPLVEVAAAMEKAHARLQAALRKAGADFPDDFD